MAQALEHAGPDRPGLADPDAFAREAHRERARAHRTGSAFLVVTLRIATRTGMANQGQRTRLVSLLADVLCRRARISDLVGWRTEDGEFGAILPCTPTAGATCFIEAVERTLQERARRELDLAGLQPELTCRVFAYPEPLGRCSSQTGADPV
jgi:hypothetical protein